jgi:hypothetical protein
MVGGILRSHLVAPQGSHTSQSGPARKAALNGAAVIYQSSELVRNTSKPALVLTGTRRTELFSVLAARTPVSCDHLLEHGPSQKLTSDDYRSNTVYIANVNGWIGI